MTSTNLVSGVDGINTGISLRQGQEQLRVNIEELNINGQSDFKVC